MKPLDPKLTEKEKSEMDIRGEILLRAPDVRRKATAAAELYRLDENSVPELDRRKVRRKVAGLSVAIKIAAYLARR